MKRMIRNLKTKKQTNYSFPLMLNTDILYERQNTILELVQKDYFSVGHHNLKSQTPHSKSNKILPLAPILFNHLI